jgi:hypothetical protein
VPWPVSWLTRDGCESAVDYDAKIVPESLVEPLTLCCRLSAARCPALQHDGDGDDDFDFASPFEEPAVPLTPSEPKRPASGSQDRAECEKTTRDAIDAIDLEMKKNAYYDFQLLSIVV